MYILAPVSVMVSMKSAASNAWAGERRNWVQVEVVRSGAGSIPASRRIDQTVDAATLTPSTSSSPCTLRSGWRDVARQTRRWRRCGRRAGNGRMAPGKNAEDAPDLTQQTIT
jgi:hypothetical protein